MDKINIGVIGLGLAWERLHAPALEKLQDRFRIVAVCDKDKTKVYNVANALGLSSESIFDNQNALLEHNDIEAVLSLVPISENFETAQAVINKGKHLIAEKPFASTPEAARKLIRQKNKQGVKVMVAENLRYEEENTIIKQILTSGQIGNPVYFIDNNIVEYEESANQGGFAQTSWRQNPTYEGGVLLDSGVHHIARMRYFFGDVNNVYAFGRPSNLDFTPFSCINALLDFEDGVAGHYSFFVSGKETQSPIIGLRIFGTHGEIFLEERHCGFVNVTYKDNRPAEVLQYNAGQGYFHEWEDFHSALRLGGKIESTPEKALGDIETIFDMIESAYTNGYKKPGYSYDTNPRRLTHALVMPGVSRRETSKL